MDISGFEPAIHLRCEFRIQVREILEDDEATHGDPFLQYLTHEVTHPVGRIGEAGGVVLRNQSADRHSRTGVELGENRVKDLAANALEIDIDSLRACCVQLLAEADGVMIKARIQPKGIHRVIAFLRSARDADHPASEYLPNLADGCSNGAGCCCDDESLSSFRKTDFRKSYPRCKSRHADDAQGPRRILRITAEGGDIIPVRYGIILPAVCAENPLAFLETMELGNFHLRYGPANHHLADSDRRCIRRGIAHPPSHVGIERKEFGAQQHLAVFGRRDISGFEGQCAFRRRTFRSFCKNEAAVCFVGLVHDSSIQEIDGKARRQPIHGVFTPMVSDLI
jgi:hypothetical protein